ncbi:uncharacterized protein FPRO_07076 [Fusarium proliferatum ET1]|uniref:Uncharacterized protein n=1 Tax=Fusarium proliferatum (strain ET1) TaxID=1227346 RepID=A0A1L7VAF6_FUSPR|nr:uncharacterized protein FPRO_07076 [Fusarium proliferatum ET1]CZR37733.1 uncharacterized protein FPRO_07076 [Fusarium proliferatum ET1]
MALFTTQGFLISALFLGVAHAGSNSTSGNTTMVGWVSPAPRRSTWDIIWSCLSIFIVCSWKCVHLNIPTHEEIQGEWHTVQICRRLPDISIWPKAPLRRKWRRKILWMTFIALAPEFGVALATRQYMDARRELKEFTKALPDEVAQRYTMIHAFYVQMGGIIIYEPSTESESQSFPTGQKSTRTRHGNRTAKMVRSLSYIQNEMLRVNEHEIKDLSKADVITKAFAIIQCTWLVMQSICRTAQGYTISLLELATLAFIFCAFIMHTFWWAKPFDVESRRIIMAIPPNLKDTASLNTLSMDDLVSLDSVLLRERIKDLSKGSLFNLVFDTLQFANPNAEPQHFTNYLPSISLYIASTTFLAIHLAAWNWLFPSNVVRSLWRWLNVATLSVSYFHQRVMFNPAITKIRYRREHNDLPEKECQ